MPASMSRRSETGFSLVETVAALGILSLTAVPLMQLSSGAIQNTARLESRLLARTTAENVLSRAMASPDPVVIGQESATEEQLGRAYDWTLTVIPTETQDLLRLEVRVRESNGEQELARLVTLKSEAP